MKYLPLVWTGLRRKPLRSILTFLAIATAFLLYGLLQGVNAGFSQTLDEAHVNRLWVSSRVSSSEPMPISHRARIAALPGVSGVAVMTWFRGYYREPRNTIPSFAIDAQAFFRLFPELEVSPAQLGAMARTRDGAIVGKTLARGLNWKLGDRVTLGAPLWPRTDGEADWTFRIVGIYDNHTTATPITNFFLNYDYFDEARATGKGTAQLLVAGIRDPARSAETAASIDSLFANSPDETRTQNEKEWARALITQIADVRFIVTAIMGAVFFTLLLLTANMVMQSVRERRTEFATMKTLGFTDLALFGLVLAEAMSLFVAAAAVGLAAATAAFPMMRAVLALSRLPGSVILTGAAAAVLLAVISSLVPALRVRSLPIAATLSGR